MSPDPYWVDVWRPVLSLLFVLGLIVLCIWLVRFYGGSRLAIRGSKRIRLIETLALDPRRRLVTIRWDDQEHLILLTGTRDLLISSKEALSPPADFSAQLPKDIE